MTLPTEIVANGHNLTVAHGNICTRQDAVLVITRNDQSAANE